MPRSRCTVRSTCRHLGRLVQVEAGRGLVGQQDLGLARQGPGQLDQAAVAQPERVDRRVGQVGDAHQLEGGLDPLRLVGVSACSC